MGVRRDKRGFYESETLGNGQFLTERLRGFDGVLGVTFLQPTTLSIARSRSALST